jgi:hypothetical protein
VCFGKEAREIGRRSAGISSILHNHLRAFTNTLYTQTGEVYQPQYLSLEAYQEIVSGDVENGGTGNRNGQGGGRGGEGGNP